MAFARGETAEDHMLIAEARAQRPVVSAQWVATDGLELDRSLTGDRPCSTSVRRQPTN